MHCEFAAVVHVRGLEQFVTEVHAGQTEKGLVLSTKWPDAHCVHCEFVAVVHVSGEMQKLTEVQARHKSGESEPPGWRYVPLAHNVHRESAPFVQVSGERQFVMSVHAAHTLAPYGCW